MRMVSRIAPLVLAGSALASCGGGKEDVQDSELKAGGQILERSITDDMLPYDTLRSQPPLAEPEKARGADGADTDSGEAGAAAGETGAVTNGAAAPSENPGDEPSLPDE